MSSFVTLCEHFAIFFPTTCPAKSNLASILFEQAFRKARRALPEHAFNILVIFEFVLAGDTHPRRTPLSASLAAFEASLGPFWASFGLLTRRRGLFRASSLGDSTRPLNFPPRAVLPSPCAWPRSAPHPHRPGPQMRAWTPAERPPIERRSARASGIPAVQPDTVIA